MSKKVQEYLQALFKAVAVYAAGAWVAVEVVDFAVRQYGLSKFLVDAAVIVSFGGGMVTAVLVWFHGESGRQKIPASEIVVMSAIVIATSITLYYLSSSSSDELESFAQLAGYRLVLEYRDTELENNNGHIFKLTPMEAIKFIEGGDRGIFTLTPGKGEIRGPVVQAQFEGHPTMLFDSPDSDFVQVTFVLPFEPADVRNLVAIGASHDGVKIATEGLNLQIDSVITITEREQGATIRINKIGPVEQ